jgi:hypothetical protein
LPPRGLPVSGWLHMNRLRNNVATMAEAQILARARGINVAAAFTAVRAREDGDTRLLPAGRTSPRDYAELRARALVAAEGTGPQAAKRRPSPTDDLHAKVKAFIQHEKAAGRPEPTYKGALLAVAPQQLEKMSERRLRTHGLADTALALMRARRQSTDLKHATFAENYRNTILELSK